MSPKILVRTITDVVFGFIALGAGALVQVWVIFHIFYVPGISADQVLRDPRIWPVLLVQPTLTLSILTLVLYWRDETWHQLGLRQPDDWMRFVRHITFGMVMMLVAAHLIRNLIIWPFHLQSRLSGFATVKGNPSALAGLIAYVVLAVG